MSSSTSPAPLLRICHFDGPFLPLQPYFCYANEVCCKEGCCSDHQYKYFQSWYFWLALVVLFILYRYICWHCRKPNVDDSSTDLRAGDDLNSHIVNLMVAYNNLQGLDQPKDEDEEGNVDPPPVYNVAINLPRPESSCQQVPTYEQATTPKNL